MGFLVSTVPLQEIGESCQRGFIFSKAPITTVHLPLLQVQHESYFILLIIHFGFHVKVFFFALMLGTETSYVVDDGYPKKISVHWSGVPDGVDACAQYGKRVFFMKDDKYFRVTDKYLDASKSVDEIDDGYPRPISTYWKGIPDNVDAMLRRSNGKYCT